MMNTDIHSLNSNSDTDRETSATPPKRLGFVGAFTGDTPSHSAPVAPATHNTYEAPHTDDLGSFDTKTSTDTVPPQPQAKPELLSPKKPSSKKPILGLLAVLILMLGSGAGLYLMRQNQELRQQASSGDTVIATVGEEKIYQKDLDTELQYFPVIAEVEGQTVEQYLLNKIIEDSILLQDAQQKDPTLFNNPNKDYLQRTQRATQLRDQKIQEIQRSTSQVTGYGISIWYNNQNTGSSKNIDANKTLAQTTLSGLQQRVNNGELTAPQAIGEIRRNAALEALDPRWKQNAVFLVQLTSDTQVINRSQELTNEVRQLTPGKASQVYDTPISPTEGMYTFVVVDSVNSNRGNTQTYSDWVNQAKSRYAVSIN